jgi:hypothetical protein
MQGQQRGKSVVKTHAAVMAVSLVQQDLSDCLLLAAASWLPQVQLWRAELLCSVLEVDQGLKVLRADMSPAAAAPAAAA